MYICMCECVYLYLCKCINICICIYIMSVYENRHILFYLIVMYLKTNYNAKIFFRKSNWKDVLVPL